MDIIILAGGFGTRMKEINNGTPKALMQIDNVVFLDYLLEKVFKYVITHVYLSIHYKPEYFHEYIEHFSKYTLKNIDLPYSNRITLVIYNSYV